MMAIEKGGGGDDNNDDNACVRKQLGHDFDLSWVGT